MLTKASLVKELTKSGLSYRNAGDCLEVLLTAMIQELSRGETIQLRGFGTFYVTRRAARKTNISGEIPEHGKIMFRPSDTLRKAVWGLVDGK